MLDIPYAGTNHMKCQTLCSGNEARKVLLFICLSIEFTSSMQKLKSSAIYRNEHIILLAVPRGGHKSRQSHINDANE